MILLTRSGIANMKHDYKNNAYWYNNAEGKDKYDTTATFSDPQMKKSEERRLYFE